MRGIKRLLNKGRNKTPDIVRDKLNILNSDSAFSTIEEYKALRTNITFCLPSGQCKIIGITSAEAEEGKSITCINLALAFAETKARVLIIDCDLRRPRISSLLSMPASPGLSNVLVSLSSPDEVIHTMSNSTADVILSGDIPPNPSELLASDQMRLLLEQLAKKYDYIFLDSPPINLVTDAVILSKWLTGILFVVRAGLSEKGSVINAVNHLTFVGGNILGFLLNGIKTKSTSSRYSKYYR
ncbi:capsular exopolysaccharide family [Syntrophobotulus glycolicus DSM 8271]|uniref:non-specific protein-tyrosine kinase n=1 Tax=Syntrophobotulus glycolicus (strain DSM 8271 / FlGlyR) TaxID=645991 RepID=F0SX22_SYNGF|nr:CpsD/CapB family tyrosine-protein kinase [Syntrophobotulus glycolicus]ADY55805.1 capsular exopolysaccharide family [Syntrophobotulus glycolicus DSM 8271]